MRAVRTIVAGDVPAVAAIVACLPDYFTAGDCGQPVRDTTKAA
jgi:hypothetical protein